MTDKDARAKRADAVQDLVELRVPVEDATAVLSRYPWDIDKDLFTLTRADALRMVRRYMANELTAVECTRWAEALEGRDDVGFEEGFAGTLKDFLFQVATPDLAGPLTREVAIRWDQTLQ